MFRTFITAAMATTFISTAVQADEVNVYSYRQPELIKPLFDAFTEKTGIDVNIAFLKKGLVEKLVSEGDRSPADLVVTVDISRLSAVVDAGVTQSVNSNIINANIPADFRDPEGHWFGLTSRARVIYASKDRVADGEVTTYEDLASDKWKGRICTRAGTNAYNLALTSSVIAHHGEEAAKTWLKGVKGNLARKPSGNDRAQIKAIWAGECDISIGNTYYMKKLLANEDQKVWADSVRIVFPKFENGGTHVNLSGVTLTKAAPNKENAIKLMEFLTGEAAQEIYAETNGEYPLRPGSNASELVSSWGELVPDEIPLTDIAKLRPTSLRLTEEVAFDE
ncbi:Fe(3+) ABC transporter substrate-binding protein [Amylibacter sp. SFDW26]|uniref:Fe(3+) ABC transporter substrate-binding protein n=1 Tax=Amylibacter sp. SFDW26 TaxID=2652722 RepID=UPI001261EA66|nr:Fe(3+) ABC transporter substrate-binding protein [Amylibacter sp. SFDW26]KAB7613774.1 Fe(3+) ABC transporter substrate-binding protein [Amylibacter sp. SFDW26]